MPRTIRPQTEIPSPAMRGTVSKPPTAPGDEFEVTVPSFDELLAFQVRHWVSPGLPQAGDEVLIVEDETGEPWAFAPATGGAVGAATLGFVFHGDDPSVPRPSGFASIEWMGSVEPANAVDHDTWIQVT